MLCIRLMTPADVPFGMRLKEQAGWNQTAADWQRFLDLEPDGCFLALWDGAAVGTVTTCTFGPVAWVAMMLVDPALRGRGIGRALMMHALAYLEGHGVRCVRLDATPLGEPLYAKLGFAPQYTLTRYEGVLPAAGPETDCVTPLHAAQFEELRRFDRDVTGTDRTRLLDRLIAERPGEVHIVGEGSAVAGYLCTRPGTRALFVGPCLATGSAGPALFADLCRRHAGERIFLDVPDGNRPAVAEATQLGLVPQRPLLRMARGPAPNDRIEMLWTSSGPEMG
jgi:GNAT superfamily N-acetyltransferase